jgi:hypothetical protein
LDTVWDLFVLWDIWPNIKGEKKREKRKLGRGVLELFFHSFPVRKIHTAIFRFELTLIHDISIGSWIMRLIGLDGS